MEAQLTRQYKYETMLQTTFVLIGLAIAIGFIWLLVIISLKLLGIVLLLGGLWMVVYFPWQADYQKASFTGTIMILGILIVVLGAALLFLG